MTTKYLIRDDGVIQGWTEALSRHPRYRPYVPAVLKVEAGDTVRLEQTIDEQGNVVDEKHWVYDPVEDKPVKVLPPINLDLCSKLDCVLYAKDNFGVDLKMTHSLTKLRAEVSALLGSE